MGYAMFQGLGVRCSLLLRIQIEYAIFIPVCLLVFMLYKYITVRLNYAFWFSNYEGNDTLALEF